MDTTPAKLDAVHRAYREQERRRAFFTAEVSATLRNIHQGKQVVSAEDVLDQMYPRKSKESTDLSGEDVAEHGARGDWKALRSNLKGHTNKGKRTRAVVEEA